ncbi:N-acetylneuraminate synthase [Oceanisphaera arctica]|uniref:N-acetylneuraminate synthase n=1 Tax=Oceanisphaera arctica TaxID=641510 RepID=A0A2P5TK90_9GAMM|nr:N-acetylneuraminate synthase [Oceanisphaera arctica]PPL15530.1 N-acetylneuraminate synthase [Oceanisphaera arctica]GHA27676.1 N-acetylneuraminate synthase [Oceanisphaera arctica]
MVKIIAEAGVNHNGSAELAFKLVDAAHAAGVDIVKFQTFKAKSLVTKTARQAEYQTRNTGVAESQFDMLSRLELDHDIHKELIEYCKQLGIEFLSTAFDAESLSFLVNDLGLKTLKIPSGELTNAPFVLEHARTGCDLIVSTGMATLAEVETALGVIAFGLINETGVVPGEMAFAEAYASEAGREALKSKVTLLHCTTEYPAPMNEINLRAMQTMVTAFGLMPGYSDHSAGITIPVAAAAMGAQLIEKHFTLDKTMEGPDHKASLEPDELIAMVRGIRDVEQALGNGIKGPQLSEIKNKPIARKSLVAAKPIKKGECFSVANLTTKRPGEGIEPIKYWSMIGNAASCDYEEDQII